MAEDPGTGILHSRGLQPCAVKLTVFVRTITNVAFRTISVGVASQSNAMSIAVSIMRIRHRYV